MNRGARAPARPQLPPQGEPERSASALDLPPPTLPTALVLGCCVLWWLYLVANSQMILQWDAGEYNALGEMLARQGWRTFLTTGPHREPVYPLLVAVAIRVGEIVGASHHKVLAALQCALLLTSQLLLLRLAARLRVRPWLALAAAGYFGVSPAIVNSGCSMFSEVLSYPFVLAAVLVTAKTWEPAARGNARKALLLGLAAGLAFTGGALTKGVLAHVSLLVAMFFIGRGIAAWRRRQGAAAVAALAFAAGAVAVSGSVTYSYMALNRRFNGNFEFTTRYLGLLYGNAAKRALPLTARQYLAHAAAIPGDGVCRLLFTEEECAFCEFGAADELWLTELPRRLAHVPAGEQRAATLRLVAEKVLQAPAAYVFVGVTQVLRMPFWESTQLSYVTYPDWLARLYAARPVRYGVRLALGLLTFGSLAVATVRVTRRLRRPVGGEPPSAAAARATVILVAGAFMALHLPFSTLTRYALPVAPLFLLLIADTVEFLLRRREGRGHESLPHP